MIRVRCIIITSPNLPSESSTSLVGHPRSLIIIFALWFLWIKFTKINWKLAAPSRKKCTVCFLSQSFVCKSNLFYWFIRIPSKSRRSDMPVLSSFFLFLLFAFCFFSEESLYTRLSDRWNAYDSLKKKSTSKKSCRKASSRKTNSRLKIIYIIRQRKTFGM